MREGPIMEAFRKGLESNTGNYISIIQFFVTNKEKDIDELKREFSKEYGPRPFNKYYNQYRKSYNQYFNE